MIRTYQPHIYGEKPVWLIFSGRQFIPLTSQISFRNPRLSSIVTESFPYPHTCVETSFRSFRGSEHVRDISSAEAVPGKITTKAVILFIAVMTQSHPLSILSIEETNLARDVVKAAHPNVVIDFREIFLQEPPKAQLQEFLALEHAGRLSPTTPRPPRLALCQYDVIGADRIPQFHESVIDVVSQSRVNHTVVGKEHHASLTLYGLELEYPKTSLTI